MELVNRVGGGIIIFRLLLYYLFLLVTVSGCSSVGDEYQVIYSDKSQTESTVSEEEADYTIAVIPKLENIPYFNAVEDGAFEAARELGVKVIYQGPQVANANQQIKIITDLINNNEENVDVIAISANDPKTLVPILEKAQKKGIHVITWDADTLPEGREFFINMVDPETLGRHLMDTLAWNVEEQGEFAIMTGAESASNLNEWLKWIKIQQQEYYPDMKLVEITANDDNPNKAYLSATRLIEDYPNLKGIIGNSSVGPPSAAQAVKEAGKSGDIVVVGLSPPNPMNEYLKNGAAQVITLWSPKKLGYLTVLLSKNLIEGTYPYDGQAIPGVGKIRMMGDVVIMGEPIDFNKENVDQYDF
ncbi:autoinducer 2 ABC transporter substrate-binding protein [Aquibacillus salsiterrae]|uniref:Autoinducer 2 ABC transporter substrate-binding protein n=1 Tax=Aquibacillus salsiterrae TaxID=2950439 RepID=A0A9X4AHV1_9BACI|nr:autoinducer 2 ABC transporter substrate-binding protein [Aquibacillus salsiterrae]MDC3418720.1 autoinducer 2 ABC transporter substrate-binding protein [Aquibacillus salsiterrae]